MGTKRWTKKQEILWWRERFPNITRELERTGQLAVLTGEQDR